MNSAHKAGAGTAVPASATPVATTAPQQLLTRRIRLIKRHIHAGLPKGPGEEIELLHDLADWLVAEGAVQEIEPAVNVTPTTASTPSSTSKKEK